MKPREKVEHIRTFARELIKFDEKHPGFLDRELYGYLKHMPYSKYLNPFNRLPVEEEDDCIQKLFSKSSKTILRRMYASEFVFVKYISWEHFFIEHTDKLDIKYETLYHILGDDILFTDIYVPLELVKHERQRHFYLPKTSAFV